MSKKDFQAIAAAIYGTRKEYRSSQDHLDALSVVSSRLADVLAASNPRFDRARFIEACETGKCKGMRQVQS